MSAPYNPQKYYCPHCKQSWRTVYNLEKHKCPLRKLDVLITGKNINTDDKKVVTTKENNIKEN